MVVSHLFVQIIIEAHFQNKLRCAQNGNLKSYHARTNDYMQPGNGFCINCEKMRLVALIILAPVSSKTDVTTSSYDHVVLVGPHVFSCGFCLRFFHVVLVGPHAEKENPTFQISKANGKILKRASAPFGFFH